MDPLERIRTSFAKQGLMTTLGAKLGAISPGAVEIILIPSPAISQQHGFVHAGAVSSIADSAAGYASLSLVPSGTSILSAEFKINLVAPAFAGATITAHATCAQLNSVTRRATFTIAVVDDETGATLVSGTAVVAFPKGDHR